jgi:hypothetical protein
MVLTPSDIGTNPATVEVNLTTNFKMAKSWDALLLIDEADVFMERRSTNDLTRNSLVAGKLSHDEDAVLGRIFAHNCTRLLAGPRIL